MPLSDLIYVILSILSFILAAISVVTVVVTLRQNHHMIENATRPYVTIYGAVTCFDATNFYIVLRNFGRSSAEIKEFSSNVDFSKLVLMDGLPVPFAHIVGYTLAPDQAIQFPINYLALRAENAPMSFHIRYSFHGKTYDERATINMPTHRDHLFVHTSKAKDSEWVISNVLQEIAVRQL